MAKHWLAPRVLAARLARAEVSNREVASFMLANLLWGTAIVYSGLAWSNPPWTLLSLWEAALIVVVTVFGMIQCFEAAGGDSNARFAADFNCLSFPIGLWTTVFAWSAFWALSWAYRRWAIVLIPADSGFADVFVHVAAKFEWFLTMAATVGSQAVFFIWMRNSLRTLSAQRDGGEAATAGWRRS